MTTPFNEALNQGYSQEEIIDFAKKSPKYSSKYNEARQSGYSDEEIFGFFSQSPKKPSLSKYKGSLLDLARGKAEKRPIEEASGKDVRESILSRALQSPESQASLSDPLQAVISSQGKQPKLSDIII